MVMRPPAQMVFYEVRYLPSNKTVAEEDAEGNPDIPGPQHLAEIDNCHKSYKTALVVLRFQAFTMS